MKTSEIIRKYTSEDKEKYAQLALKAKEVLSSILKPKGIVPHSITSREKDPKSLIKKIYTTEGDYDKKLREITDLAGVRVITYFPKDIDKIVDIIEKEFKIDRENSIDKRKKSDPSIFGYASVHLVVEFSPVRLKLSEYSFFKDMKCEIQVRTILQHAWAEIEHDIVYKSTEDIPFELRRRFSSLAGVLEVADREFESIRQDEMKVRKRIKVTIEKDNIDIPVNLDSLLFYLKKYHKEKKIHPKRISNLMGLIRTTDIKTILDLDQALNPKVLSRADKYIQKTKYHIQETKYPCTERKITECLIRYFLAIGFHFKIPLEEIENFGLCPILRKGIYQYKKISQQRRHAIPTTGEKPGVGTYKCTNCGTIVRLDDPSDTLPPCPKCNNTEFGKVS